MPNTFDVGDHATSNVFVSKLPATSAAFVPDNARPSSMSVLPLQSSSMPLQISVAPGCTFLLASLQSSPGLAAHCALA